MRKAILRCTELAFCIGAASAFFDGAQAACTLDSIDDCIRDDPAEAVELFERELADSENVTLLLKAGVLFRDAPEPVHDENTAVDFFERAAKALGNLYLGIRDYEEALVAFEQATKAGHSWAMIALADMLIKGTGTTADPERAVTLLEQAAEAGLKGPAFKALGDYYFSIGNHKEAVAAFEQAAAADHPWAMIFLAYMLIEGEGITADPERAVTLLEQAAEVGLKGPAFKALGDYYFSLGNLKDAVAAFEQAAAAGHSWAMIALADMFIKGEGTTADPARAVDLLEQAAEGGLRGPAFKALGDYQLRNGDHEAAVVAFEQAVEVGDGWAKVALAELLIKGQGTSADRDQARELLQSALKEDGIYHAYVGLMELAATEFPKEDALELGLSVLRDAYAIDPLIALNSFEELQPSHKTALLQAMLLGEKLYLGPIDGVSGHDTVRAVGKFCSENAVAECASNGTSVALLNALFGRLSQRPLDFVRAIPESDSPNQSIEQNVSQPAPTAGARRSAAESSEESAASAPSDATPALVLPPALLPTRPPRAGAGLRSDYDDRDLRFHWRAIRGGVRSEDEVSLIWRTLT